MTTESTQSVVDENLTRDQIKNLTDRIFLIFEQEGLTTHQAESVLGNALCQALIFAADYNQILALARWDGFARFARSVIAGVPLEKSN